MKNQTNSEAAEIQNKVQETEKNTAETELSDSELETIAGGSSVMSFSRGFVR
jgi:chromosome segregation and condensation protein ScpB